MSLTLGPRPDFNEYPVWSQGNQSRGGDTPTMFLLHTQEGGGNVDSLARYLCPQTSTALRLKVVA